MRYFSCKSGCAIATCDDYDWELLTAKSREDQCRRRFKVRKFDFGELQSATDGFSAANLLGRGSYGYVYKAKLHRIQTVAAVKMTKEAQPSSDAAAGNEVEILSQIYHPRLVNLIGYAVDSDHRKLLVVEYMPNGTLHDLLHRSVKPPGWAKRSRFAMQVAKAVQFLHSSSPPIIHRDIKSSNVLIDSRFNSRISDFGLALRGNVEDVRAKSTPPAGTIGYLDPAYVAPGDLSAKSDVFSFGILLLEIISGRHAIDVNYSPPSVVDWAVPEIKSGNLSAICDPRISLPEDAEALRRMAVLAASCVRSAAARRPAMAEALECLKDVYRRIRRNPNNCVSLGQHVKECPPHVIKYEPLDDSISTVKIINRAGGRKSGKLTAPSANSCNDVVGICDATSDSIGSATEIVLQPSDGRKGLGAEANTVEVSESKSMLLVDKEENVKEEDI